MNSDLFVAVIIVILYLLGIGQCRYATVVAMGLAVYSWCAKSRDGNCASCVDKFPMSNSDFNDMILTNLRQHEGQGAPAPPVVTEQEDRPQSLLPTRYADDRTAFYNTLYGDEALAPRQNPGLITMNALR